jgi:hypothetical protein
MLLIINEIIFIFFCSSLYIGLHTLYNPCLTSLATNLVRFSTQMHLISTKSIIKMPVVCLYTHYIMLTEINLTLVNMEELSVQKNLPLKFSRSLSHLYLKDHM